MVLRLLRMISSSDMSSELVIFGNSTSSSFFPLGNALQGLPMTVKGRGEENVKGFYQGTKISYTLPILETRGILWAV